MSWYEPGGSSQPPESSPPEPPSPSPPPSSGAPPPTPPSQPSYAPPQDQAAGYGQTQPGPSGAIDDLGRPLAAWWKRVLAIVLDSIIIGIPTSIVIAIIGISAIETDALTDETTFSGGGFFASTLIGLVIMLVYFGLLDGGRRGQTVGKMALGIQVRDAPSDASIGVGRAVLRRLVYQLLWYVFFIPGLLNSLAPLWDRRRQAWHDKVGRSVVINRSG